MTTERSERQIDVALRAVPLPPYFLQRLHAVVADEQLDDSLRTVPLPPALRSRLREDLADLTLAEQLCELPVSPRLTARLRIIPRQRRRWPIGRWVATALLMLAVGVSHWLAIVGVLWHADRSSSAEKLVFLDVGPLEMRSDTAAVPVIRLDRVARPSPPVPKPLAISNLPNQLTRAEDVSPLGPAGELVQRFERGWDFFRDMSWPSDPNEAARGSWGLARRLPPRHSQHWPLENGHGRIVVATSGHSAPVTPLGSTRSVRIPLSTSRASFEEAAARAQDGRWPQRARIRSEDFIAAVATDSKLPSAADAAPNGGLTTDWFVSPGPFDHQSHLYLYLSVGYSRGRGAADDAVEDLQVDLRFDPASVAAYRIVGYGPPEADLLALRPRGDALRDGERAGVLAEVWLQPLATGPLADATLSYVKRSNQEPAVQVVSSVLFDELATEFLEAEPSLQTAVLAFETAAVLGGEPGFQQQPGGAYLAAVRETSIDDVLGVAQQLSLDSSAASGWQRLLTLLHQLDALR